MRLRRNSRNQFTLDILNKSCYNGNKIVAIIMLAFNLGISIEFISLAISVVEMLIALYEVNKEGVRMTTGFRMVGIGAYEVTSRL